MLGLWIFWALQIIDGLQRTDRASGRPLLALLPGWASFVMLLERWAAALSAAFPLWEPYQFYNVLLNGLLRILLPILILALLGFRRQDLGLSVHNCQVAAPFLVIYVVT